MIKAYILYLTILIGEIGVLQNALLLPFVDAYRLSQASFELPRLRLRLSAFASLHCALASSLLVLQP